eukprot:3104371-Rhodomonas_salina.1
MQAFFDDKIHKNDQLWDSINTDYESRFNEQRDKASVCEKFEREQSLFRSFCRMRAAFRAGR